MANSSIFLLLLLFLSLTPSLVFSSPESSDRPTNFIVHVLKTHKPSVFSSHYDWYSSIIQSLPPSFHPSKILYAYDHAMEGFSAHLTVEQAYKLQEFPGVLAVIPDQIRQLDTTRTPRFLGLTNGSNIWSNANYGEDVIIGHLDSGVWPNHPSFSDEGLSPVPSTWKGICQTASDFPASACNRKLIGARAFTKGIVSYLGKPLNESIDSASPKDTNGHGTHTATIAAGSSVKNASLYGFAKGEARGIASKARIAAYKLCVTAGCADSDMIAAFDQAISDGVHIITFSVGVSGSSSPYNYDGIAIGSFAAVRKGIVVSCSAGNSGPTSSTVNNLAPWVLTVAASTIDREFPADVVLGDGRRFTGASLYSGEPLPNKNLSLAYAAGNYNSQYCATDSLTPSEVKGKIVLCDRGVVSRVTKGVAVQKAGGVGMIMANSGTKGEELTADPHLVPATMVGESSGNQIRKYIKSDKNPTATIDFQGTVIGNSPPAPKVAAFSSRGPNSLTPQILKPDVLAPGVNILAGWSGAVSPSTLDDIDPRRVEFNILSGTSMACPHVSGIAALLRKTYPNWSPSAIKSAIMTTAYNSDNSGGNIVDISTGKEATPFALGAGHVDPNSALDPGLIYDMETSDYISFLCSIGYTSRQISIFTRETESSDVCNEKLSSPGDINYPSFSVVFKSKSQPVTYKRVVKNVGSNVNAIYEAKVDAPANVEVKVSPSKLEFSAEKKSLSYEITFTSKVDGSSYGSESFGSIEWSDGVHVVRSPIAVTQPYYYGSSVAAI